MPLSLLLDCVLPSGGRSLRAQPTIDARSFSRGTRDRVFAKMVRLRLLLVPVLSAVVLLFAFFEPTMWRRALILTTVVALFAVSIVEWIRYRRSGIGTLTVQMNMSLMALAQLGFAFASGGLFSPLTPALLSISWLTAMLLDRGTLVFVLACIQIPAMWAMAWIHASSMPVATLIPVMFGDAGALEDGPAPFLAASFYTVAVVAAARVGLVVRSNLVQLVDEALSERDRTLALHADQNRALTTLSGEIAHELKNPMTSVKGLAALLAKDVEGKSAERLAVLRREVDRMQTILEEFLNFSRPLVPLSLSETDLGQLARDVARLHEGSAAQHAIHIVVHEAETVWLRCDARKVRQVLINLVQNALESSEPGSEVALRVERTADGGRVVVLDRGNGIDAAIGERAFEAGVTTKEHGSGLGLAVARSLARQHGGDIDLSPRDGGGARAELTLPRRAKQEAA